MIFPLIIKNTDESTVEDAQDLRSLSVSVKLTNSAIGVEPKNTIMLDYIWEQLDFKKDSSTPDTYTHDDYTLNVPEGEKLDENNLERFCRHFFENFESAYSSLPQQPHIEYDNNKRIYLRRIINLSIDNKYSIKVTIECHDLKVNMMFDKI